MALKYEVKFMIMDGNVLVGSTTIEEELNTVEEALDVLKNLDDPDAVKGVWIGYVQDDDGTWRPISGYRYIKKSDDYYVAQSYWANDD